MTEITPSRVPEWDPTAALQEIQRMREHVLTDEALTPEDRQQLLEHLDALEREALHPERSHERLRAHAGALGSAAEAQQGGIVEALGPDRIAALTGLLPHV